MTSLIETAQLIGMVVLALLLRAAFFLGLIAALVVVFVPIIYAYQGGRLLVCYTAGRRWFHGLQWRRSVTYAPGHLWLRQRKATLRFGLDALAARLLRGAARVVLPAPGTQLLAGQPLATFDAGRQLVMLPAPFDGFVTAINDRLAENAAVSTRHPYGRGWLLEFAPADDRFAALPRGAASRTWFDGEAARFAFALDKATGVAMADGGEPMSPGDPVLGDAEFARLAHEFLHADVTAAAVEG